VADHNDPNSVNSVFSDVDRSAADVTPFLTTFPYLAEPW
jgi:hypothetical protein